jgi:hypothetical protein
MLSGSCHKLTFFLISMPTAWSTILCFYLSVGLSVSNLCKLCLKFILWWPFKVVQKHSVKSLQVYFTSSSLRKRQRNNPELSLAYLRCRLGLWSSGESAWSAMALNLNQWKLLCFGLQLHFWEFADLWRNTARLKTLHSFPYDQDTAWVLSFVNMLI